MSGLESVWVLLGLLGDFLVLSWSKNRYLIEVHLVIFWGMETENHRGEMVQILVVKYLSYFPTLINSFISSRTQVYSLFKRAKLQDNFRLGRIRPGPGPTTSPPSNSYETTVISKQQNDGNPSKWH